MPVPRLREARRAGSPIAVYVQVQFQEPKTGQEKAQFYCEDVSLFLPSYYLSMPVPIRRETVMSEQRKHVFEASKSSYYYKDLLKSI